MSSRTSGSLIGRPTPAACESTRLRCSRANSSGGIKWLASGPKILILNDPTRGVDVGAKAEIYHICDQLARDGLGLLFTSSEIDEILGLCDRVLVLYKGRIVKEFCKGEANKSDVMHWISGEVETPAEAAA